MRTTNDVRAVPPQKTVRIQEPAYCPSLYQVSAEEGADVCSHGGTTVIRMAPCGMVILGMQCRHMFFNGRMVTVLRMPDGWVVDEDKAKQIDSVHLSVSQKEFPQCCSCYWYQYMKIAL